MQLATTNVRDLGPYWDPDAIARASGHTNFVSAKFALAAFLVQTAILYGIVEHGVGCRALDKVPPDRSFLTDKEIGWSAVRAHAIGRGVPVEMHECILSFLWAMRLIFAPCDGVVGLTCPSIDPETVALHRARYDAARLAHLALQPSAPAHVN